LPPSNHDPIDTHNYKNDRITDGVCEQSWIYAQKSGTYGKDSHERIQLSLEIPNYSNTQPKTTYDSRDESQRYARKGTDTYQFR